MSVCAGACTCPCAIALAQVAAGTTSLELRNKLIATLEKELHENGMDRARLGAATGLGHVSWPDVGMVFESPFMPLLLSLSCRPRD